MTWRSRINRFSAGAINGFYCKKFGALPPPRDETIQRPEDLPPPLLDLKGKDFFRIKRAVCHKHRIFVDSHTIVSSEQTVKRLSKVIWEQKVKKPGGCNQTGSVLAENSIFWAIETWCTPPSIRLDERTKNSYMNLVVSLNKMVVSPRQSIRHSAI